MSGSGRGQSEWPVQVLDGPNPIAETLPSRVCSPAKGTDRGWGRRKHLHTRVMAGEAVRQHREAIGVPTIGKGWAGIATGYGKAS